MPRFKNTKLNKDYIPKDYIPKDISNDPEFAKRVEKAAEEIKGINERSKVDWATLNKIRFK